MVYHLFLGAAAVVLAAAVPLASLAAHPNPFDRESALPFGAPEFDKIHDSDFQPAFEAAMARERTEIEAIAHDPAPPTFANTILAMEKSGRMLDRVSHVFFALTGANTNDTLDKIEAEERPKLSALQDATYLNPRLFARVKAVYEARDKLGLDPESLQLIKITYDDFAHAGAGLSSADQAKLSAINTRLATLSTEFRQKLLAATKSGAFVTDAPAALAGLSPSEIAAAAQAAKARGLAAKWVIPLQNTTQQPALQSLTDRGTRKALFDHSWIRTEKGDTDDTRATLLEMVKLRAEKARLLGFPDFASFKLADQMAKTPTAVDAFVRQLVGPTRARAALEAADIQTRIDKDGGGFKLAPWDWEHYSEEVRKAKYDLDEAEIKPYFELYRVLQDGVFYAANQLYGMTFKERKDLPVYQSDVKVFEVFDKNGSSLGLIYFDYFKRDNKQGGAWMGNFVEQSKLLGQKPVVYNVANFTKPAPGEPALISFDDLTTMFHEFGHALHGLFADQTYGSISGTNVARDFVEFPSQFNEHWALDPKVLTHYAYHYKTGAPMPAELVAKIKRAAKFNKGYDMGELIAAAELDMQWHELAPDAAPTDVDAFETEALKKTGTDFPNVPPRYRSSYFQHIFAGGYSAGYYAYLWTQMLADDSFAWFTAHGGLTRENGQRFRDLILSRGHTEDYGPMFKAFYGKDPDIGPMLTSRGLAGD
ncbi:MAG TPA: peptidyl-dipeptidase Dcp [Caulobacteraceae bacterium]|nr:peptidyl-dipeptidase Dcp [Caulobacteraceae bacterium]